MMSRAEIERMAEQRDNQLRDELSAIVDELELDNIDERRLATLINITDCIADNAQEFYELLVDKYGYTIEEASKMLPMTEREISYSYGLYDALYC